MKRNFTSPLLRAFLASALTFGCFTSKAIFTPITFTSGLNADVVANGVGAANLSTNNPFDYISANPNYVLVAGDFKQTAASALPIYFLPATGTIPSAITTGLNFQLAAYTGNNSLRLTNTVTTGTLVFSNQTLIGDVYVMGSTGTGSATATITVNFVGGTNQQFTNVTFNDWFNNTPFVVQGIGRANRATGLPDAAAGTTNPRFYQAKLALSVANYSKQIISVVVTRTGGSATTSVLNVMAITVDHTTCLPAQGLAAAGTTTVSSNLSWNTVVGAAGYQYAVTASATPPASGTAIATNSYNATGLTPGTTYYLHVRADCGGGTFSIWNTFSFTTLACPTAGAPSIVSTAPGTVTFSWPGTATPGVVTYQYAVTSSTAAPATWLTTNSTSATVSTGLVPGNTYYAHVRSNCGTTNAGWLNVQFVNPYPPCYSPVSITVSNINVNAANINWDTSTGTYPIVGYQYAVNTSATPPASGTATPNTSYTPTNLAANTTYYAHVRTHCSGTNFSAWTTTSFTTPSSCVAPLNINISNVTSSSALISWTALPGDASYEYFLDQTPTAPAAGVNVLYNSIAPLNLFDNTTYYIHVRSNCGVPGFSGWTTASFTTLLGCHAPLSPVASNVTSSGATVSWAPIGNASNYEYAITSTFTAPSSGTSITATTHTATGLNSSTTYYFHVRTFCTSNEFSPWKTINFTTLQSSASVSSTPDPDFNMEAYPNPVSDVMTLHINGRRSGAAKVQLTDMSGKIVMETAVHNERVELNFRDFASGVYLLRYTDNEHTKLIRVQKL